jgi:hypothetical protein
MISRCKWLLDMPVPHEKVRQVGLFPRICKEMHGQQNIKFYVIVPPDIK